MALSDSRRISLIALLTAIAILLNQIVRIPAPFDQYLLYEFWEIPILLGFLLLGFWSGTTIAFLNTLYLFLLPQPVLLGPVYNLLAVISMVVGVLAAMRVARSRGWGSSGLWISATALGSLSRTLVMTLVNAAVVTQPPPIGYSIPSDVLLETLLFTGVFNLTVTLYTVPLAFSALRAVRSRYRFPQPGELAR